jgi:hypothetical protein
MIPAEHRKSVTFNQNGRSRSVGKTGHVQTESAVNFVRNTHYHGTFASASPTTSGSFRNAGPPAARIDRRSDQEASGDGLGSTAPRLRPATLQRAAPRNRQHRGCRRHRANSHPPLNQPRGPRSGTPEPGTDRARALDLTASQGRTRTRDATGSLASCGRHFGSGREDTEAETSANGIFPFSTIAPPLPASTCPVAEPQCRGFERTIRVKSGRRPTAAVSPVPGNVTARMHARIMLAQDHQGAPLN